MNYKNPLEIREGFLFRRDRRTEFESYTLD